MLPTGNPTVVKVIVTSLIRISTNQCLNFGCCSLALTKSWSECSLYSPQATSPKRNWEDMRTLHVFNYFFLRTTLLTA